MNCNINAVFDLANCIPWLYFQVIIVNRILLHYFCFRSTCQSLTALVSLHFIGHKYQRKINVKKISENLTLSTKRFVSIQSRKKLTIFQKSTENIFWTISCQYFWLPVFLSDKVNNFMQLNTSRHK